ncbi:MAG: DUF5668 domain-containing protein [candidate division Zixibacteria bacterium]|nr:DUF5668 domain-containing protein [candidate division Zixibacteria bacterium]
MKEDKKNISRRRPVISGFILLALGIYLQLWSMDLIPDFDKTWPLFIIIIGLALIFGAFTRKREPGKSHL